MALATADLLASFDITDEELDLSPVLRKIFDTDLSILKLVKEGPAAKLTTHYWKEDKLFPHTVTQSGSLSAVGVTLTVASGQHARLRVGMLLKDRTAGKSEVIEVTAAASESVTVARAVGFPTAGETHSAGAIWDVIAAPKQEGADVSSDISQARITPYNYTMIFERGVNISGTQQSVASRVVRDEVAYQAALRMEELRREMAKAIVAGARSSSAGSDTVYRKFMGILRGVEYGMGATDQSANANRVISAEPLTEAVLRNLIELIEDDGGIPNFILGNRTQLNRITDFGAENIEYTPNDKVRGAFVSTYMAPNGWALELIRSRWMPTDTVIIGDRAKMLFVPLQGRTLKMTPIAKTGDAEKRQIIGEYSFELHNALEAFAIHKNLSV